MNNVRTMVYDIDIEFINVSCLLSLPVVHRVKFHGFFALNLQLLTIHDHQLDLFHENFQ